MDLDLLITAAAVLIFIVQNYNSLIFLIKFIYFYASLLVVLLLIFVVKRQSVFNMIVCSCGCKHFLLNGVKWNIRGVEYLVQNKTYVIVSNHQSRLDMQGMFNIWNEAERLDANEKLNKKDIFGFSNWLRSFLNIARTSRQTTEKLKSKNVKIWIFPEGTRRNTGKIHKFIKRDAFSAAVQAQVPVLPVVFSSYKTFMHSDRKILNEVEVIITVLPPKPTKRLTQEDVDDLIQLTRDEMVNIFEKTSLETEKRMSRS